MNFDFNKEFWATIGVNHRVFEAGDVFKQNRDKQADEVRYNRYLDNPEKLSSKAFLEVQALVKNCFDDLILKYLFGTQTQGIYDEACFYLDQILNIAFNFHILKTLKLNPEVYINMCAFQLAYIMHNMNMRKIDISIFLEAMKSQSLEPYIKNAKQAIGAGTNKTLAMDLSYKHDKFIELINRKGVYLIESVGPSSYEKKISEWKREKELPSLFELLLVSQCINSKVPSDQGKRAILIQLLLTRALLSCKYVYKIEEKDILSFIEKFYDFLHEIPLLEAKNLDILKSNYIVDIAKIHALDLSLDEKHKILQKNFIKFADHNLLDFTIERFPNADSILQRFNNGKFKDVIEELEITSEPSNILLDMQRYFVLALASIKIKDQKRIRKYIKLCDVHMFSGSLLLNRINPSIKDYCVALANSQTFKECSKALCEYFDQQKKLSTFE